MKATARLHELGQSLWLDNITRDMLNDGTLKRYIDELSITGLTSNPTIFDHAISKGSVYDASIREKLAAGRSGEDLFFELALDDLGRAADLFRPVHERTSGVDGCTTLSPGTCANHASRLWLCCAAAPVPEPPGSRTTIGTRALPPNMKRILAA